MVSGEISTIKSELSAWNQDNMKDTHEGISEFYDHITTGSRV
jgi:hypothetical protein